MFPFTGDTGDPGPPGVSAGKVIPYTCYICDVSSKSHSFTLLEVICPRVL